MSSASGFFLHHGNRLSRLAEILGRELAAADGDWLAPETVLVPQASMRRWLQNSLAERFGIAANLSFRPPAGFLADCLQPWLPYADEDRLLTPDKLQWRLFALLNDRRLLAEAPFAPVRRFLACDQPQTRAWQLASELNQAFEAYQAWRRPWLLAWTRRAPEDDWQGRLWHTASQGMAFRAQAVDAYLRALARGDCPKPPELPGRISVFACQNLSPDALHVLQSFGRWSAVRFFLHNPCEAYWGDVRQPKSAEDLLRMQGDNPLLNQWGAAGRDFTAVLLSEQSVHWAGERGEYLPAEGGGLLQRLQDDLLTRAVPVPRYADAAALRQDDSVQIHDCASPLREVQTLRAQLLGLMQRQPELQWRDIAVMAPDLDRYAPYFPAVFGAQDDGHPALPFALGDRGLFQDAGIAGLFFGLLALGRSRLSGNEGLTLLGHPLVMAHYDLTREDLERLRLWLAESGVRWGLDAGHRAAVDGQAQDAFTWRHALTRLLYGYADDDTLIDGVAPVSLPAGQDQRLLSVLYAFVDTLDGFRRGLSRAADIPRWQSLLQDMLAAFCPDGPREDADIEAFNRLNARIAALGTLAEDAGWRGPVAPDVIEAYLGDEGDAPLGQAWLSGRITVCRMVPMRLIPFKVICLLGMDEGAFPREDPASAVNRLAGPDASRETGDRNRRDEDRFLMLQLLSSCGQHLLLSYIGRDPVTGETRAPSLLVKELLQCIGGYLPKPEDAERALVVRHPIHAHEPCGDARAVRISKPVSAAAAAPVRLFAPLPGEPALETQNGDTVSVDELVRFWQKPMETLARRQGLHLPEHDALLDEREPYGNADGLAKYRLVDALLAHTWDTPQPDIEHLLARLQAEGQLAPGAAGRSRLLSLYAAVREALADLAGQRIETVRWPIDLRLADGVLDGELRQHFRCGLVTLALHRKAPKARDRIDAAIRGLAAAAAGHGLPAFVYTDDLRPAGPPPAAEDAMRRLADLLALYREGRARILCFDPELSLDWAAQYRKTPALTAQRWLEHQWAEQQNSEQGGYDAFGRFLTHGDGFLKAVALAHPQHFHDTALRVHAALFGEDADG